MNRVFATPSRHMNHVIIVVTQELAQYLKYGSEQN